MSDKTSSGGETMSKAARGQTIVRAYPLDESRFSGALKSPGDAELDMKNTGLSRSLGGATAAGPTPGRKDRT